MKMRTMALLGIALGVSVASVAAADGKDDRRGPALLHRPLDAGHVGNASPSASAAHEAREAREADAGRDHDDEDLGAAPDEKPENKEKRRAYVHEMRGKLTDAVKAGGKQVTDEERDVIRTHWRQSMRLYRIRQLALQDGDKAVVARVDALLAKEDGQTTAKLKELNAKAPMSTAPTTVVAPASTAATGAAK